VTTLAATVDRIQARTGSVDWRRVALVVLMALPFAVGYSLRWTVRALARSVWAVGWVLGWAFYTAAEGWSAAGGRT